jgi:hypothetical protein
MFLLKWDSKVGGTYLAQISKVFEDMAEIINISESIEADGHERK